MRRLWVLALAVGALLSGSGIVQGQSLNLAQTFPDALTAYFNFTYTASTGDFSLTDHLFGTSPNQYTNSLTNWTLTNGGTSWAMNHGSTFTMNVYINNSGVPLTSSQLSAASETDSCVITGTPSSGPYAGQLIDFYDSTSLAADGNAGTKSSTNLEFEFNGDANGVQTGPGWQFGVIMTNVSMTSTVASGASFESNLWTQNFSNSTSYLTIGANAFDVPEPSSVVLMLGSVFMFARRSRRQS
jgi:hypothetical protein